MCGLRRSSRFLQYLGMTVLAMVSMFVLIALVGFINRLIQPLSPYGDVLLVAPLFVFIYTLIRHRAVSSPLLLTYGIAFLATAVLVAIFIALVALTLGAVSGLG